MDNIYIPKSWADITVEQYQEMVDIKLEGDYYSYKLELLSLLNDTTIDDELFENLYLEDINKIISDINWITKIPRGLKEDIEKFKLRKFNKITLGEFIDINYLLDKGPIKNLHMICAVLYKKWREDEWENEIYEPYIYDLEVRSKYFLKRPIIEVIDIINDIVEWKNNFVNNFKTLFKTPNYEMDYEDLSNEEIKEIEDDIEREKVLDNYSWLKLIWDLSDKDITKYEGITNLPLIIVFNTLAMKKTLDI